MPFITAKVSALIKQQNKQSTELDVTQKITIARGDKLACRITPEVGDTLKITLQGDSLKYALSFGDVFYIYRHDWTIEGWNLFNKSKPVYPKAIEINGIPYYAQNDTSNDGFRLCNSHACAMLAAYLLGKDYTTKAELKGYFSQPELLYINQMRKFGDSTDHNVQTQTLDYFGVESYWSDRVTPELLYDSLQTGVIVPQETTRGEVFLVGIPMVVGQKYKQSGHITLVTGYKNGNYIINDPNGKRNGVTDTYFQRSTNINKVGEADIYSAATMDAIFWDLGRSSGYGRIVTAIRGVPTGLK